MPSWNKYMYKSLLQGLFSTNYASYIVSRYPISTLEKIRATLNISISVPIFDILRALFRTALEMQEWPSSQERNFLRVSG